MSCSTYQLFYNGSGALSAFYRNCGDNTPFTVSLTGGGAGALWNTIIATTNTVVVFTGSAPASGQGLIAGGFVYTEPVRPWAQYTLGSSVSALSAHGLVFPAN